MPDSDNKAQDIGLEEAKARVKELEALLTPPLPKNMVPTTDAWWCNLCQCNHAKGYDCKPIIGISA